MNKILIIAPHPDDEAICCGGLIMKAKKLKDKVFVLYMSTGGSRQFTNGETREVDRLKEALAASEYGDFLYKIAFKGTATKVDTIPQKELIEFIENEVTDFKPDIVVVPFKDSYAQDHRAVAEAAISAFRPMPSKLHPQPKMILEYEEATRWPVAFNPNFYVDISDVMEEKIGLYKCHATQFVEDPHPRSYENLRRIAGVRGTEIGVKYAEGYNLLRGQL
jgi:LmbE family N-acetylglucosaminyl deacetylase